MFSLGFGELDLFIAEFFALFVIVMLASLALIIIIVVGLWKILEKGNQPGWGALIPIYNLYLLCEMVGISPWWILIVVLSPILEIIPVLGELIELAILIYFAILLNVSLARAFKKEDGFAVGLILLAPIFYPILGFGEENQYTGKNPMKDIVFEYINGNKNNSNVNEAKYEEIKKYCPACGNKLNIDTKYCPNCGKEL